MLCERCGYDLADSAIICPSCGANTSRSEIAPPTSYGDYASGYTLTQPQSGAGYSPQQGYDRGYQRGYAGDSMPPPRQPNYGSPPPYANQQPPGYGAVNVTVYNNVGGSNKKTEALVVEIIASLFGIYGIGWLMAGETTPGIVLLVGSVVLYWPIFILGTIFTLGIGLLCLGPLAIAAIITNAILLNNALNRKATPQVTIVVPPAQAQQMPPQYPRM